MGGPVFDSSGGSLPILSHTPPLLLSRSHLDRSDPSDRSTAWLNRAGSIVGRQVRDGWLADTAVDGWVRSDPSCLLDASIPPIPPITSPPICSDPPTTPSFLPPQPQQAAPSPTHASHQIPCPQQGGAGHGRRAPHLHLPPSPCPCCRFRWHHQQGRQQQPAAA